jgi:hypothetical protein
MASTLYSNLSDVMSLGIWQPPAARLFAMLLYRMSGFGLTITKKIKIFFEIIPFEGTCPAKRAIFRCYRCF